jgi:AcrR family transcriptional regulator
MPRLRTNISLKRLRELAAAAIDVFSRQGFERSQVADVAKVMGVSPGTIYLYVESKEALFDLAIRHAASNDSEWLDEIEIPIPTPLPDSTLEFLRQVLGRDGEWPLLASALRTPAAPNIQSELEGIILEQYRLMTRHRAGLVMLARSAFEFPGLAEVFVLGLRKRLLDSLGLYLQSRIQSGQIRPLADTAATTAALTQTIVWANLQRPFDPGFNAFTEQAIEHATVDLIVCSLINPKPLS